MYTYKRIQNNGELETLRTTNSSLDAQKYYFKQTVLKFEENSKATWAEVKKATELDIQLAERPQYLFDLLGKNRQHNFRAFDYRITGKEKLEKIITYINDALSVTKAEQAIIQFTIPNSGSFPQEYATAIRDSISLPPELSPAAVNYAPKGAIKQNVYYLLIITVNA